MEERYIKQQEEKHRKQLKDFTEKYLADKEFWEFQSLSVFINNNPFENIYEYVMPFDDVEDGGSAVIVGVISNVLKKNDRNGKKYACIQLYSSFGIIEIMCWHQQYTKYLELITKGSKVAIKCKKKENKAFAADIKNYEQWLLDTNKFREAVQ